MLRLGYLRPRFSGAFFRICTEDQSAHVGRQTAA